MTTPPASRPRLALALAAGLAAALLLAVVFPPGRHDVPPAALAATAAIDEGYWTAPLCGREGPGSIDRYDHDLALCLALPQNALGRIALSLGAPLDVARWAGSFAAVFALGALAVLFGGLRGFAVLGLLACPFAFGNLASDLADAPSMALVALWLHATARGRPRLAAMIAGIAAYQKGAGIFLGLGSIAAALAPSAAGPGRGRRFLETAVAGAAGAFVCAGLAWALFHDAPFSFLVRPLTVTADVRPPPVPGAYDRWAGMLVQVAFAGAHGGGPRLAWLLGAAVVVAPRARPGPAVLTALLAGLGYYALFPDPQRLLPVVPLLLLPAFEPGDAGPPRGGTLAYVAVLAAQATASAAAALGVHAHAWLLGALSAAALAATLSLSRLVPARGVRALAGALVVAAAVAGPLAARASPRLFSRDLHDLAGMVASRVGPGADVMGYGVLSTRLDGRLWYTDFRGLWEDELARRRPRRFWRVHARPPGAPPDPREPGPAGYQRVGEPLSLGPWPYRWDDGLVDVWLEEFQPPP